MTITPALETACGREVVASLAWAVRSQSRSPARRCLAGLVFSHIEIRTDMTDFLPRGRSDAARLMLEELRSGAATSLVILGIEGAPPDVLARISRRHDRCPRSLRPVCLRQQRRRRSARRDRPISSSCSAIGICCRPVTTPEAFTVPTLRDDMQRLLRGLQSSAAPLGAAVRAADPPGAFLAIARDWIGASKVRSVDGVWFAPDARPCADPGQNPCRRHGHCRPGRRWTRQSGRPSRAPTRATPDCWPPDPPCSRARPLMPCAAMWNAVDRSRRVLVSALLLVAFPLAVGHRRHRGAGGAWHRCRRAGGAARLRLRARRRGRLRHDHAGGDRGLPGAAGRPPQAGRGRARDLAAHRSGLHAGRASPPRWD